MDTVFFVAAKVVGALIRPDTWIILLAGLSVLTLMLDHRRLARALSLFTFATLLLLAILPVGDLLLKPFERSYPANPPLIGVDGIIVLGGAEDAAATALWQQPQLNQGAERFTSAMALAHRFPQAQLLFTGGSGKLRDLAGGAPTESSVAAQFFASQGLAEDRLLLEGAARNTTENATLAFALARPEQGETWVLITSAFHMPRAMRSFEAAGWEGLIAYPVDYRSRAFVDGLGWNLTRNLDALQTAVKEYIGLLAYRITGRGKVTEFRAVQYSSEFNLTA